LIEAKKFYKVIECDDLSALYNDLRNYEGTYRFKNLLFFNSIAYGTFIYDIENPKTYVEHFSMCMMSFEKFNEIVLELMRWS
jgi:hypothetical protein